MSNRGAAILIVVGLFLIEVGRRALVDPRIQGARDVNILTSDEIGPGEQFASRVGGAILIMMGIGCIFLVVYIKLGYGF